jgi:hypothetical protein
MLLFDQVNQMNKIKYSKLFLIDIWLITNGYNNGLVQLVGQAIRKAKLRQPKQKMVALAICKWGSVKNPQKLIYSKKKETKQIVKKTNSSDTSDDDEETKLEQNDEHDLDMNHTHYLMLDDARYRYIDTGDFRTRLCNRMTRLDREDDSYSMLLFDRILSNQRHSPFYFIYI